MPIRIERTADVVARTGSSRSTLYLRIREGLWPKPVSIGARAVGWPSNETDQLLAARIAGMSDDEIRELVCDLELARNAHRLSRRGDVNERNFRRPR